MASLFTVAVSSAGFTDQLVELDFFGRLGRAAGMDYAYSPIHEKRTSAAHRRQADLLQRLGEFFRSPPPNIHDTLGVNQHLKQHSKPSKNIRWTEVLLSDEIVEKEKLLTGHDLVHKVLQMRPTRSDPREGILLRLAGGKKFFRLANELESESVVSFPAGMEQSQQSWHRQGWFVEGNTLLHFRAGDLAVLQTDDGQFVPLRRRSSGRMQRFADARSADSQWIDDEVFIETSRQIIKGSSAPLIVCSDGFERSTRLLADVKQLEPDLDARLVRFFQTLSPGIKCSIGEEYSCLLELINGLMSCSRVITKDCGVLVLKFLSLFRPDNLPEIHLLHRGDVPTYNIVDQSRFEGRISYVRCD